MLVPISSALFFRTVLRWLVLETEVGDCSCSGSTGRSGSWLVNSSNDDNGSKDDVDESEAMRGMGGSTGGKLETEACLRFADAWSRSNKGDDDDDEGGIALKSRWCWLILIDDDDDNNEDDDCLFSRAYSRRPVMDESDMSSTRLISKLMGALARSLLLRELGLSVEDAGSDMVYACADMRICAFTLACACAVQL